MIGTIAGVTVCGGSDRGGENDDSVDGDGLADQYPAAWVVDECTGIVIEDADGSADMFSVRVSGSAANASKKDDM